MHEHAKKPIPPEIEAILKDPKDKRFRDLRDRAAYVYITGTYPSHLRTYFTRALGDISVPGRPSANLGAPGCMQILPPVAERLNLEAHPMVVKVREKHKEGYRITVSRGANERMNYTKIFMSKGGDQITVQIDGSVLDRW